MSSVTGRKWTNADWKRTRASDPQRRRENTAKRPNGKQTDNKLYQQALGAARGKAADQVLRTGLTRATLLAGIPIYNALTDETELVNADEVIEPELVNGSGADSLIYYARDHIGITEEQSHKALMAHSIQEDNSSTKQQRRSESNSSDYQPMDCLDTEKAYYDYMRSNPQEVADRYISDGWIQV